MRYDACMDARDRITTTIDHSLAERIDAVAKARDESRSAAVERMLRNQIIEEENLLAQIGTGVEGRVMSILLQNPKILNVMSKLVGESLTDEELAKLEDGGPGVIAAGKRFRSYQKNTKKGVQSE